MRYKLRTLLILLAILPPLLWLGWTRYEAWKAERERRAAADSVIVLITAHVISYEEVEVELLDVPTLDQSRPEK